MLASGLDDRVEAARLRVAGDAKDQVVSGAALKRVCRASALAGTMVPLTQLDPSRSRRLWIRLLPSWR